MKVNAVMSCDLSGELNNLRSNKLGHILIMTLGTHIMSLRFLITFSFHTH